MVVKIEAKIDKKEERLGKSSTPETAVSTSEETPETTTPTNKETPETTESTNEDTPETPVSTSEDTPVVTGEEVTRLTELVDDIQTTGLNGSATASEDRAKASDAYLKEKEEVLNAAAQEHQIPVSIISAITSRESDGKGALRSLTYFETTPALHLQKIKDCIVSKLAGYNYHSIEEFQQSKYYKYTLSDMKGLTADDYHLLGSDAGDPRPCTICLFEKTEENVFVFKDRANAAPLNFKLIREEGIGLTWEKQ